MIISSCTLGDVVICFAYKDEEAAQSTFGHIQTSKAFIAVKKKIRTYLTWTLDAVVATMRVIRCRRKIEREIGRRVLKEHCKMFFEMLYTADGSAFGKSAEYVNPFLNPSYNMRIVSDIWEIHTAKLAFIHWFPLTLQMASTPS